MADVTLNTAGPDFSFLSLFLHAHPVVQLVVIGLLLSSVWSLSLIHI